MREDLFAEVFGGKVVWRVLSVLRKLESGTVYGIVGEMTTYPDCAAKSVKKALYPLVSVGIVRMRKEPVYARRDAIGRFRTVYELNRSHRLVGKIFALIDYVGGDVDGISDLLGSPSYLRLLFVLMRRRSLPLTLSGISRLAGCGKLTPRHMSRLLDRGVVSARVIGDMVVYEVNNGERLVGLLVDLFDGIDPYPLGVPTRMRWVSSDRSILMDGLRDG